MKNKSGSFQMMSDKMQWIRRCICVWLQIKFFCNLFLSYVLNYFIFPFHLWEDLESELGKLLVSGLKMYSVQQKSKMEKQN